MVEKTLFFCKECGNDFPRWQGQCPSCNAWNSLTEEKIQKTSPANRPPLSAFSSPSQPTPIDKVSYNQEDRISSGIQEFDRVLGGGIVPGSVILIGGDPGIGKSTLMLQAANSVKEKVLYVSGEESLKQIRMRAERLKTLSKTLDVLSETNLLEIEKAIDAIKPKLIIIDSIQTMYLESVASAPGSVGQIRESAAYLMRIAKTTHIPIFIVGHVTKDGNIAGPKILEHVVDTVLYFEGDEQHQFRLLRGVKNRFGSISEVGIFEMKENGLETVANPSEVFLSERPEGQSGSAVAAAIEGTRPLLLEIQALTAHTSNPMPRRAVVGADYNRALMVAAVLEKRLNIKLSQMDLYINVAGGIKVVEPALDLPIAVALISCYKNKPIEPKVAIMGEVGLAGEVRAVSHIEARVKEAEKLGFKKVIIPQGNVKSIIKPKIEIVGVSKVADAFIY